MSQDTTPRLVGRIGITPNRPSFRFGGLRTHLAGAAFLSQLAHEKGAAADLIVRVDDTNTSRVDPRHEAPLIRELRDVGQIPLRTPGLVIRQSERLSRHRTAVERLADSGLARMDSDGSARVVLAGRELADVRTPPPGAPWIRVMRSGRRPLWHLASAVDDAELGVRVCVRGVDKLNAEPVQCAIIRALGAVPPTFYYLPRMVADGPDLVSDLRQAGLRDLSLFGYLAASLCPRLPPTAVADFEELVARVVPRTDMRSQFALDRGRLRKLDRQISGATTGPRAERDIVAYCRLIGDVLTEDYVAQPPPMQTLLDAWPRALTDQHRLLSALARGVFKTPRHRVLATVIVERLADAPAAPAEALLTPVIQEGWQTAQIHQALRWVLSGNDTGPEWRALWAWHAVRGTLRRQVEAAASALKG